jgi:hypothetical protein
MTDVRWVEVPRHVGETLGQATHFQGCWTHAHPHDHPGYATHPDPEVRRLAHPDSHGHAHEHRFQEPEHHHHSTEEQP